MNIASHIGELLYEHDCVIIPGFGGFVGQPVAGSIDNARNYFRPPYKQISFNRQLKNNDGLLANQIARKEGVSYNTSLELLKSFVKSLEDELGQRKQTSLHGIGNFVLGKEKNIVFTQDQGVNYLPESYGLRSFVLTPIQREPIERKVERKLKERIPVVQKGKIRSGVKRRSGRTLVLTTMVVLFAALLFFSSQNQYLMQLGKAGFNMIVEQEEPKYEYSEYVFPKDDKDATGISDLLALNTDTTRYLNIVINGSIPIVVRLKEDTPVSSKVDRSVNHRFHIVGGAFAVPENAKKLKARLKMSGYNSQIIDKRNSNLKCVSYGGYATREEALNALERIREVQGDAWLMTI